MRFRRGNRLLPIAVALGLVALMTMTAPKLDEAPRDWTTLVVGERGEIRELALTVTSVRAVTSIALRDSTLTSSGVFVVVGLEADALVDAVTFQRVQLRIRTGERYDPREEWIAAEPPLTEPGFTSRGTWVFEIPRDSARGAKLLVENDPREFDGYDHALRVDLGLGSDEPRAGPLRLADATTRVTR